MDWGATKARLQRIQKMVEPPLSEDSDYRRRVLLERARVLSAPRRPTSRDPNEAILVFRSGADRYGLLLEDIVEVIRHAQRTVVPGAPPHVAGLIQVRGDVRPVYHLETLLDPSRAPTGASDTVLLLHGGGAEFAVLAGEVEGVREVSVSARRPPPPDLAGGLWATEDLITVLDVAALVGKER